MNASARKMNDNAAGMQTATGRDVRNLASLGETASTSRVLNLSQIYLSSAKDKDYLMKPFFKDSQMNKAILVKHTLRSNERMLFSRHRRTATKVILPFDPNDLKLGGRSVFVNQIGFDSFARSYFNTDDFNQNYDVQVLKLLDVLPSLDPFLVREHLSRSGYKPAPCYLKISPVDVQQMIGFANAEIERLVITAFGEALQYRSVKLAGKILSNELDKELWPLRATLRMTDEEFSDGIFSWRGFLYFKWRHIELQEEMRKVLDGLANYQPYNTSEDSLKEYLKEARPRLARSIVEAIKRVGRTLAVYDQAYAALVEQKNPGPFRHFLMDGPSLFYELGENIGILGHIGSFWKYRMVQSGPHMRMSAPEYVDVLMDFEDSLLNITQHDSVAF
ncbi:hypothetical protein GCM10011273_10690 [Asticcacaulis endophyticus]|uniref:Uncharacterized protein n=2 Tax=Asticcacaulis endophyticus TaxID=1395890 RepID=A0A918PY86_9CAUL|nr:hypothetical protein GCM10011273_10690 [Asticcacaulis endophyticus]